MSSDGFPILDEGFGTLNEKPSDTAGALAGLQQDNHHQRLSPARTGFERAHRVQIRVAPQTGGGQLIIWTGVLTRMDAIERALADAS